MNWLGIFNRDVTKFHVIDVFFIYNRNALNKQNSLTKLSVLKYLLTNNGTLKRTIFGTLSGYLNKVKKKST